jgi:ion channel
MADTANDAQLKGLRLLQERYGDPILTGLTALLLVMMFCIAPLQAADVIVFEAFGLIVALAMVLGVLVMSRSPVAFVLISVAVAMNAVGAVLRFHQLATLDVYLVSTAWLLMAMTLGWVVARQVFAKGRVNYHRVVGAVLLYLLIALFFVAAFAFVGLLIPNAFQGIKIEDSPALASNLIYFSFVTLTSTGYGDVLPVHPIARSLCNIETIIGQLYPATLLARLVTLELEGRK